MAFHSSWMDILPFQHDFPHRIEISLNREYIIADSYAFEQAFPRLARQIRGYHVLDADAWAKQIRGELSSSGIPVPARTIFDALQMTFRRFRHPEATYNDLKYAISTRLDQFLDKDISDALRHRGLARVRYRFLTMALFAYHTYSKKLARALVFFLDENHSDIVTNEPTRYYNEWLEALRHLDGLVVPPTQLAKCKNYFLQRRGHFLEWDPLFERGRRTSRSLVQCEPRALTVPPIRHRSRPFYLPAPSMSPIIRSPSADDAYVGGALEEIADGVSYIGHKMDYVQQDVDNIKMILDGTIY